MTLLRAVFDTNVLVSALISEGLCDTLLEEANAGKFLVCVSPFILRELERVLHNKFKYSSDEVRSALLLIRQASQIIDPKEMGIKLERISRDPDDDHILAAAIASGADFIITGDLDLLHLKTFRSISILAPRDFLMKFES